MLISSDQVIRDRDRNRRRHRFGRLCESHPLQPDKLTTRIRTLEADLKVFFPDGENCGREHEDRLQADIRSGFRYGQPYNSEKDNLRKLWEDKQRYEILIDDGGRPAINIMCLAEFTRQPDGYKKSLRAWLPSDLQCSVYYAQLSHWHDFRIFQRYWRREEKLSQYMNSLQDRLAKHIFTRTYQLDSDYFDSDPARQGKLATWIEYLMYEDIEYLRALKDFKRDRKFYNPARDKLLKSKITNGRDPGYLDPDTFRREWKQLDEIRKQDEAARMKRRVWVPTEKEMEMMEKLEAKQKEAKEKDAKERPLYTKFFVRLEEHRLAKKAGRQHRARMNWIHHQIHSIERELGTQLPEKVKKRAAAEDDTPKPKGKRRKCPKRLKRDQPLHHETSSKDAVGGVGSRKKPTTGSKKADKSPPRTRRSGRIAGR